MKQYAIYYQLEHHSRDCDRRYPQVQYDDVEVLRDDTRDGVAHQAVKLFEYFNKKFIEEMVEHYRSDLPDYNVENWRFDYYSKVKFLSPIVEISEEEEELASPDTWTNLGFTQLKLDLQLKIFGIQDKKMKEDLKAKKAQEKAERAMYETLRLKYGTE